MKWIVALLLSSCATTSEGYQSANEVWDDVERTMHIVRCAAVSKHGERIGSEIVDVHVVAVDDYAFNGFYLAWSANHTININSAARSLMASAFRHELWSHRAPHVLIDDPKPLNCELYGEENACHDPEWTAYEKEMNTIVSACAKREPLPAPGSMLQGGGDASSALSSELLRGRVLDGARAPDPVPSPGRPLPAVCDRRGDRVHRYRCRAYALTSARRPPMLRKRQQAPTSRSVAPVVAKLQRVDHPVCSWRSFFPRTHQASRRPAV